MTWIQTYTGRKYFPLNPNVDGICIRDIAHALSLKCRFTGHCLRFYSIADHSIRVAHAVEEFGPEAMMVGLLHDAAEAYLADIASPVKRSFAAVADCGGAPNIVPFGNLESRNLMAIYEALRIRWEWTLVHQIRVDLADRRMLATEARDLLAPAPEPWGLDALPYPDVIKPVTTDRAESEFIGLYIYLREECK